jgi:hypothetical protein
VSRDDAYIAIGYGSSVDLYRYSGHFKEWGVEIPVPEFQSPSQVKFQTLSFTPDGRFMVVATQKYDSERGPDDDAVWVYLWRCEKEPGAGTMIGSTFMPTVSHLRNALCLANPPGQNDKGVTGVFFDPTANKAFLTGFIDTPYRIFHSTSSGGASPAPAGSPRGHRSRGSASSATGGPTAAAKIRCAAQSPHSPSDVCALTAANRLVRADCATQALTPWADVAHLRSQRLRLHDEPAALAWPDDARGCLLAWKDGASFWLAEVGVGAVAAEVWKEDLRGLINQSGWMEGE